MEKKRILIVDDNEFFIQQEISYLDRDRFDFEIARSGQEALDKARSQIPDLILLDQIMSDMSGQEVCKVLKGEPQTSSVSIVIVSSGEKESSRNDTLLTGCDGLIFKPIRKDLLVTMVEELLGITTRKMQRAGVDLSCIVKSESSQFKVSIRSLSADGVFVQMDGPLIPGEVFEIRFTIPGIERQIWARSAAVVWTGRLGDDGPEGAGLRFLTIDPLDVECIDEYVIALLESGSNDKPVEGGKGKAES